MKNPVMRFLVGFGAGACFAAPAAGGFRQPTMTAWRGATPTLDGVISPGEYADATAFEGVKDWTPQFLPVTDDADLSLEGWVKHDGENLYFAFRVVDDVLYGIDTERWLPDNNPNAHELSPKGFPWFGDEMEILLEASKKDDYPDEVTCAGDGSSWQMVCNLTKSRLGGVGVGGLLEGEPRSKKSAWETYRQWILTGAQKAAVSVAPDGKGYTIEWMIRANPCLEVEPGKFWSPDMGPVKMGLNIALGDLDTREAGGDNPFRFRHEQWWSGEKDRRAWLKQYGTLILDPRPKPRD